MNKRLKGMFLGGALLVAPLLYAVPARNVVKTIVQPDGTTLQIKLCGDEFLRYYTTLDGIPVKEVGEGFYYAGLSADTLAVCSDLIAHEAELRTEAERQMADSLKQTFVALVEDVYDKRQNSKVIRRAPARAATRSFGSQILGQPMEGKKKGLVILVNFSDVQMKTANPNETFYRYMNEEGYKENGQYGSVRDYFLSQSYGKFDFSFDVVGPVTLPNPMSYYGRNVNGYDYRAGEMVLDACLLIKDQVDFSVYDWNGDGEAEQIFVVYAGYAESNGAPDNTIWPHQSYVQNRDGSSLVINGTRVGKYACSSELTGTSGTTLSGIGTMCHEFSHCFGIPDFYDTYGSNFGMDVWSLMDYGCYNNGGNAPIGYTAYERMMCGWLDPVVLTDTAFITDMPALSDEPVAYAVVNDANANEYYLLENRQKKGWDYYMYGHGMMVVHVDYDARSWDYNTVNTKASRQRMTIIPADNRLQRSISSYAGDLFPGTAGVTQLTDTGTPGALLHTPNKSGLALMSKPIYNIQEKDGKISFDFLKTRTTGVRTLTSDLPGVKVWQVYRTDGSKVGEVNGEQEVFRFPSGLYLLRSGNETRKVLVR